MIAKILHGGDESKLIASLRRYTDTGDILALYAKLNVISRFQLRILHVVLFHMHECRIRICLGKTVSAFKSLLVMGAALALNEAVEEQYWEMVRYLSAEDAYWLTSDVWKIEDAAFRQAGIQAGRRTAGELADFSGYPEGRLKLRQSIFCFMPSRIAGFPFQMSMYTTETPFVTSAGNCVSVRL